MEPRKILIIDDDEVLAASIAEGLERSGYECRVARSGKEGIRILESNEFDVVLTDLVMDDVSGLDILRFTKNRYPTSEVVVITGYPSYDTTVEALEKGALDYIIKEGLNIDVLRAKVKKWIEKRDLARSNIELQQQLDKHYGFEGIIGSSESMVRIFDVLHQIASTTATVLIYGESGTGKELIARAIHNNSPRRGEHFVPLNCAALSESILESELFGHEKGAFTGATYTRKGRFEFASKGTLFLDEIGDMPLSTQVKLLRVIEYGEITRVGSNEPIQVDVRLIAATNKNLEELVKQGKFREDLFFRLKVVTIDVPPLRERKEDIPLLIDAFLQEFSQLHHKSISSMTPSARKVLFDYSWPGNVRELRNCIESMMVVSKDDVLDEDDVPTHILQNELVENVSTGSPLDDAEKRLIKATLVKVNGNRAEAAKQLGIGERTLYRKIKLYGIS